MPWKDPAKRREYMRKYRVKYYWRNPDKWRAAARKFIADHREELTEKRRELKKEVIAAYGGKCECCGNHYWEHLTVDHVNGGGSKHRAALRAKGQKLYEWLKANNFPKEGFRLLCMNCNWGIGMYGICPHKQKPELALPLIITEPNGDVSVVI